jgi:hypothetical protein
MRLCVTGYTYLEKDYTCDHDRFHRQDSLCPNSAPYVEVLPGLKARFRNFHIDTAHPYFPKTSDLKVLRPDTVAAIIMTQSLLENLNISTEERKEMMLLVANSNFIDDQVLDFDGISRAIEKIQGASTHEEKNRLLNAEISPLIPLRTLTNGSESFIAQYTQILGENTTYGSTALATAHALSDANTFIRLQSASSALVGGTHFANLFSFLNHYLLIEHAKGYSESSASCFLLLESEEGAKKSQRKVLGYISDIQYNEALPENQKVDWLFIGGAFSEMEHQRILEKTTVIKAKNTFSWFPYTGNMGCAELGMMISSALQWMTTGNVASIYLEDAFGKYVTLNVEKA